MVCEFGLMLLWPEHDPAETDFAEWLPAFKSLQSGCIEEDAKGWRPNDPCLLPLLTYCGGLLISFHIVLISFHIGSRILFQAAQSEVATIALHLTRSHEWCHHLQASHPPLFRMSS